MNTKYNEEFFDSYLRGECSSDEQRSFENTCSESTELKEQFEQFKSYRELVHGSRTVKASEQFTNDVIRKVRQRNVKKSDSLHTLFTGFFSREMFGVMATLVIVVVVLWPQLQPDRALESSFSSMDRAEKSVSLSEAVAFDDVVEEEFEERVLEKGTLDEGVFDATEQKSEVQSLGRQIAKESNQQFGLSSNASDNNEMEEMQSAPIVARSQSSAATSRQTVQSPSVTDEIVVERVEEEQQRDREPIRNELERRIAITEEGEKATDDHYSSAGYSAGSDYKIGASEEYSSGGGSDQFNSRNAESYANMSVDEVQMEEVLMAKSASFNYAVQHEEVDMIKHCDEDLSYLEQQLRELQIEVDSTGVVNTDQEFPFTQFDATVDEESGDTIYVTVPNNQSEALIELWTDEYGVVLEKNEKRRKTELKLLIDTQI